jgi:hypothetical protein
MADPAMDDPADEPKRGWTFWIAVVVLALGFAGLLALFFLH